MPSLHFWIFVPGLLILLFAVAYSQCFWTNFLNSLLVILSSAVAVNYAQLLANLINDQAPDWSGFTEFLCMWLLFIIVFLIAKLICNQLSRFPVRTGKKLDPIFDWIGCGLLTLVMYSWISFTFFASPVGEEGFNKMMRGSIPYAAGRSYGFVVMQLPSNFGMNLGGQNFDVKDYITKRLDRAADEVNHDDN